MEKSKTNGKLTGKESYRTMAVCQKKKDVQQCGNDHSRGEPNAQTKTDTATASPLALAATKKTKAHL